ncbi:MAG: biotin--[acetyl-CoA-carboxylase] ligase [Deltaproteobacteria bacterium]|nr:biotin--[acetyl-CoA-carboxylase] ligase [Deltaproteobacteria bacterium]
MNWNSKILEKSLAGKFIGHQLHYYEEIGSTNDEAFRLGSAGAPEGTALIAESQSAGKGRLQRSWHSPEGANIYTSIILRPDIEPAEAPQISILAGVAVAEVLNDYCPDKIKLKWPNDVLIDGKKVCGILSQVKTSASVVDFIVLGMGINVNINYNQFPEEIRGMATSLVVETGHKISRLELIISLYEKLTKWYMQLLQNGFGPIKERWLSLAPMIGQMVQVMFREEEVSGRATGLDDDGSLILLIDKNETLRVSAGDATILKR